MYRIPDSAYGREFPYSQIDDEPERHYFKCIGCEEKHIEEAGYLTLSVGKYCFDCALCDNVYDFSDADNEIIKKYQIDKDWERHELELRRGA